MSLQTRLAALLTVIGADIKEAKLGKLLDVIHVEGANPAYKTTGAGPTTVELTTDAAGTNYLQISYTPLVNCWWDLNCNMGLMQKLNAVYGYAVLQLVNVAGAIPAVGGFTAMSAGSVIASALCIQRSDVQTFEPWSLQKVIPLTAGVSYTIRGRLSINEGSWQYGQNKDFLFLQGKVYSRAQIPV